MAAEVVRRDPTYTVPRYTYCVAEVRCRRCRDVYGCPGEELDAGLAWIRKHEKECPGEGRE